MRKSTGFSRWEKPPFSFMHVYQLLFEYNKKIGNGIVADAANFLIKKV